MSEATEKSKEQRAKRSTFANSSWSDLLITVGSFALTAAAAGAASALGNRTANYVIDSLAGSKRSDDDIITTGNVVQMSKKAI